MNLLAADAFSDLPADELGVFAPLRSSAAFARSAAEAAWDLAIRGEAEIADLLASEEALNLARAVRRGVERVRGGGSSTWPTPTADSIRPALWRNSGIGTGPASSPTA